jgi:hypothetical protein
MVFLDLSFELLELLQLEVGLPRLWSQKGPTLHHESTHSIDGSVDATCLLEILGDRVPITHEALS